MQPSLLWTALVFLFHPQELTWLFLPILFVVFVMGVTRIRSYERALRPSLLSIGLAYGDPEHQHFRRIAPKEFIRAHLADEASDRTAAGVPGALITIGILGTFVGLGVAIKLAAGNLDDPVTAIASLEGLLSTVAFKFQTSAWGIILSLVFQLGFLRRHEHVLEEEMENQEREMMRIYEPAGFAIARFMVDLDSSTEQLRSASIELKQVMEAGTGRIHAAMTNLETLGPRLESAVAEMSDQISSTLGESYDNQAAALAQITARTGDSLDSMSQSISGFEAAVRELAEGSVDEMRAQHEQRLSQDAELHRKLYQELKIRTNAVERLSENLGELVRTSTRELADQTKTAIDAASQETATRLESVLKQLEASLRASGSGLEGQLDGLRTSLDRLPESIRHMDENLSSVLDKRYATWAEQDALLHEALREDLASRAKAVDTATSHLDTQLQGSVTSLENRLASAIDGMEASVAESLASTYTATLSEIQGTEAALDAKLTHVVETGRGLGDAVKELEKTLGSSLERHQNRQEEQEADFERKLVEQVGKIADALGRFTSSLAGQQEDIQRANETLLASLDESIRERLHFLAAASDRMQSAIVASNNALDARTSSTHQMLESIETSVLKIRGTADVKPSARDLSMGVEHIADPSSRLVESESPSATETPS